MKLAATRLSTRDVPLSVNDIRSSIPRNAKCCYDLRLIAGLNQEREVRVNADHAGVARFLSSADPTYYSIKEILLGLERDIQEERKWINRFTPRANHFQFSARRKWKAT